MWPRLIYYRAIYMVCLYCTRFFGTLDAYFWRKHKRYLVKTRHVLEERNLLPPLQKRSEPESEWE